MQNLLSRVTRTAAALLFALVSPAVLAGGFQVTPTIVELAPGGKTASYQIHNRGTEPVTVQVDVMAWSQDGAETLASATDVVVAPRIATLAPGKSQLVRIALRAPTATARAYRVKLREVPPPPSPDFHGLRTLVEHNVPLFFMAPGKSAVAWRATLDPKGQLRLSATNSGGRHHRSTAIRIVDATGAVVAESRGPRYVLPRSTMQWDIPTRTRVVRGTPLRMQLVDAAGRQDTVSITVE